jgi:predicted small metal-binding protein
MKNDNSRIAELEKRIAALEDFCGFNMTTDEMRELTKKTAIDIAEAHQRRTLAVQAKNDSAAKDREQSNSLRVEQ